MKQYSELMASYNQWMNAKVYDAADKLSEDALLLNRGAYFGSILHTLNHIVVGDIIWLKRFAIHPDSADVLAEVTRVPNPVSLDALLFDNLASLRERREWLDDQIINWVSVLNEHDRDTVLHYESMKGIPADKRLFSLIMHFFNHQTHHRGQASVLLSQAGLDIGLTDLLALIPQEGVA